MKEEGVVGATGGLLPFPVDLVGRTQIPLPQRVAVQACGVNLAEGHACSPSGMREPPKGGRPQRSVAAAIQNARLLVRRLVRSAGGATQ